VAVLGQVPQRPRRLDLAGDLDPAAGRELVQLGRQALVGGLRKRGRHERPRYPWRPVDESPPFPVYSGRSDLPSDRSRNHSVAHARPACACSTVHSVGGFLLPLSRSVMSHRIAVIGGDGIGPEVVSEAIKVARATGVDLETVDYDLGASRY